MHACMEDDDDEWASSSSSQMLNNNTTIASSLLYCDEEPLVSTPLTTEATPQQQEKESSAVLATVVGEEHLKEELLVDHMARQRFYAPTCRGSYLEHLLLQQQQGSAAAAAAPAEATTTTTTIPAASNNSVSAARSRGVQFIIYAFGRLGLTVGTLFNAVNYLDRFLSINCHLWWEAWMVELVSVACLSIACKLDEVNIPSLHHLQMEMEEVTTHSFLPATVRDMELTLLKALQWRLACITPYSFLELLLPLTHTTAATAASTCCTRLLILSLGEPSFIQFDPFVVASSALRCVTLDRHHHHHQSYGYISGLIRPDCPATAMDDDGADECFRMMETLYASCCSESDWDWKTSHHQLYSSDERLWSPVSVIIPLLETASGGGGTSAVSRRCLFDASSSAPQRSTGEDSDTHVRDEDISHR